MPARVLAAAGALAVLLLMTGCGATAGSPPAPSGAASGDDTPEATDGDSGDEAVTEEVAVGDITAEQLCAGFDAIDVISLIGEEPTKLETRDLDDQTVACGGNTGDDGIVGGITSSLSIGDQSDGVWQQFLTVLGDVVMLDGIGDEALYDEDLETGYLPVVTIATRTGDTVTMLQFAPVLGAPVPAQAVTTDAFVDFLDAVGVPH